MNVKNELLTNLHREVLHGIYFDYNDTSSKFIDLITIMGSLFVFETDIIKEKKDLDMSIPVFDVAFWNKEKDTVEALFEWITDKPVPVQFTVISPLDNDDAFLSLPANQDVALFYDDIESIAGLTTDQSMFDYIRVINKDNEKQKQQKLAAFLRKSVADSSEILDAPMKLLNKRKTTPAAILFVLAIAAAKSYFNGGSKVFYYRSKQINIDYLNKPSLLPKTAHPKTYQIMNNLYKSTSVDMKIETPFLQKSRAEIIKELPKEYKQQIKNTNDCVRMKRRIDKDTVTPCGICMACLQRKIALTAAESEVYDGFYQYDYGQKIAEITNEQDQQIYTETLDLMQALYEQVKTNQLFTEEEQHTASEFIRSFDVFLSKYSPF
ncbi:hypothetical protein CEQ21_16180 [Niallia circulans]|uniref:Uncharacterized protein n=1 Tax=Niallia circulans TaxID=1397 RepID=A0A553SJ60_NIACI|nr:7-cyano-7-deazaguanine synthase [Niallia circulans]TRZ37027.1 hypothetical protein CEQ21_16180 [Niallia circulans]